MHRSIILYVSIFIHFWATNILATSVSQQSPTQSDSTSNTKNERAKFTSKVRDRQTTEYRERNSERVRIARAKNPLHFKSLDRKNYMKRKSDPAILEHDKKMRKKYYQQNKEKIAATKLAYARRKAQEKREKRLLEGNSTGKQKKRVRSSSTTGVGEIDHNSVTQHKKQRISGAKDRGTSTSQSTEIRTIARLKLSPETIKAFYGSDKPAKD